MTYSLSSQAPKARALSEEALALFRELGDRAGEGRALWAYANALAYDTEADDVIGPAREATEIFREVGDRFMLAWAVYTEALALTPLRRLDEARELLAESIAIFQTTGDLSGYALVLDGFAAIEWLEGNRDRAMRIAGAAAAIQDVSGVGLAQRNRDFAEFFPAELLKEAPLAEAYAEGQRLTADEAVALALESGAQSPTG